MRQELAYIAALIIGVSGVLSPTEKVKASTECKYQPPEKVCTVPNNTPPPGEVFCASEDGISHTGGESTGEKCRVCIKAADGWVFQSGSVKLVNAKNIGSGSMGKKLSPDNDAHEACGDIWAIQGDKSSATDTSGRRF